MPNESSGDNPAADSIAHPSNQSPVPPSAPEQNKVGENPEYCSQKQNNQTAKLERDIKTGEICLIVINALLLITTIVIARIYYGQLVQMRIATEASTKAANAADATLKEIQKGGVDTHELAVQAKNQADRTKDLADRTRDQSVASKQAADAATSAADTAKETLHISERAYITSGTITWDEDRRSIKVPLVNSGHIPSGRVAVIIHQATANITNPLFPEEWPRVAECHWRRERIQSIPVGSPFEINLPVPKFDKDRLESGFQQIFVAGYIQYEDGFPGSLEREWPFCTAIVYQKTLKRPAVSPCESSIYIPRMEMCDKYPANEEH